MLSLVLELQYCCQNKQYKNINCQKGASAYTELLLLLFFAHLHSNIQQRTVLVYFLCLNRSRPKIDRHQFDIDLERTITVYHHHQQQPYTRRATTAQRRQRITAKSNKLNHSQDVDEMYFLPLIRSRPPLLLMLLLEDEKKKKSGSKKKIYRGKSLAVNFHLHALLHIHSLVVCQSRHLELSPIP